MINDITSWDRLLYNKAVELFDRKASLLGRQRIAEELNAFREVQKELGSACDSAGLQPLCRWYALEDAEFFPMINSKGYSVPVPL